MRDSVFEKFWQNAFLRYRLDIYGCHSMHPLLSHFGRVGGGGGEGVWASDQILKKEGLDRISIFRGVAERGKGVGGGGGGGGRFQKK